MLCAFGGSLVVIGLIVLFTRGGRRIGTTELLLAGVTIGLFCSAMVLFITYLSDEWQTFSMVRWMMGSLVMVSVGESLRGLPLLLPSWIVLIACGRSLNQYLLGEELAASRGVNLARLRWVAILFASLSTAVVVAMCGPIGFVGLVVPQITSLCVGHDRRLLLPAAALAGGVFLAVCDWISQCGLGWAGALVGHQLGSAILPIGVVTAIVGVPIFLALLYRRASTWARTECQPRTVAVGCHPVCLVVDRRSCCDVRADRLCRAGGAADYEPVCRSRSQAAIAGGGPGGRCVSRCLRLDFAMWTWMGRRPRRSSTRQCDPPDRRGHGDRRCSHLFGPALPKGIDVGTNRIKEHLEVCGAYNFAGSWNSYDKGQVACPSRDRVACPSPKSRAWRNGEACQSPGWWTVAALWHRFPTGAYQGVTNIRYGCWTP